MNIHDTNKEEDVSGQIIGDIFSIGFLTYDARKQRGNIYAKDDEELKQKAISLKLDVKEEIGEAFQFIFPDDKLWRLVIVQ